MLSPEAREALLIRRYVNSNKRTWHGDQRARFERESAAHEEWEQAHAEHTKAVEKVAAERAVWDGLPLAPDPDHDAWEVLPADERGNRYALQPAIDASTGKRVRIRVIVPEPVPRDLRVRTRSAIAADGSPVGVAEVVGEPADPDPFTKLRPARISDVEEPPATVKDLLIKQGKWDAAALAALQAEIDDWRAKDPGRV